MLASILLSSPGPIAVGLGLLLGRSSTQLSDFIRRTAELAAMVVSFILYRMTRKERAPSAASKEKLERIANLCVGAAMCLSGVAMLLIALLSYGGEKGNVIPGLVISILGVMTNAWFWLRYRALNKASPNAILAVQRNLYRAKLIVDACVTSALATIAISPDSAAAFYMDVAGSIFVSVYLLIVGAITMLKKRGDACPFFNSHPANGAPRQSCPRRFRGRRLRS